MNTPAPLWLVTVCLLLAACGSNPGEPVARVLEGAAGVLRGGADGQRSPGSADSGAVSEQRGLGRVEPVLSDSGARYALVIGNSTYQYSPLANPGNDARAMATVLRERGFQVDQRTDLNSTQLQQAVREFSNRLRAQRGVGVVFFAGHGVEVEGENYLIPVDNARIRDAIDVRQYALSVNYLLERVQAAGSPLNVVILDACRDNPYQGSTRSLSRGLRGGGAPSGTLIAYATAPGRTADDNAGGDNGLYTAHLVEAIRTGRRVEDVFQQVRRAVYRASNGRQEPWYNASLDGIYCIGGCARTASVAAVTPSPEPAPSPPSSAIVGTPPPAAEPDAQRRQREERERLEAELAREREQAERERLQAELAAQREERERLEAERQRIQTAAASAPAVTSNTGGGMRPGLGSVHRDRLRDGSQGPELVFIRGGCFMMGSPTSEAGRESDERRHRVCIEDACYIGKYEVTFAEYERYARATGRNRPYDFDKVSNCRSSERSSAHNLHDHAPVPPRARV